MGVAHAGYNSWAEHARAPLERWADLVAADQVSPAEDWAAFRAWVQLRILGRFDRGAIPPAGVAALPCALCTVAGGEPGPPETARHLLGACPTTRPWVCDALGDRGASGVDTSLDKVLGGGEDSAVVIRLGGRIARAAERASGAAEAVLERSAEEVWEAWQGALEVLGFI